MEVNFKAQYIDRVVVHKYSTATKSFLPQEIAFVELSATNRTDRRALRKTARLWNEPFVSGMLKSLKHKKPIQLFAITEQSEKFEKLDPKRILGLSQINNIEPNTYHIDFLQTHPQYTMDKENREYKKIGTGMLDNLKKLFRKETLKASPMFENGIIDFYLNNNFKFEHFYLGDLIWIDKFEKSNL